MLIGSLPETTFRSVRLDAITKIFRAPIDVRDIVNSGIINKREFIEIIAALTCFLLPIGIYSTRIICTILYCILYCIVLHYIVLGLYRYCSRYCMFHHIHFSHARFRRDRRGGMFRRPQYPPGRLCLSVLNEYICVVSKSKCLL